MFIGNDGEAAGLLHSLTKSIHGRCHPLRWGFEGRTPEDNVPGSSRQFSRSLGDDLAEANKWTDFEGGPLGARHALTDSQHSQNRQADEQTDQSSIHLVLIFS